MSLEAASNNFRNDGALVNALTGMGFSSRDKTVGTKVGAKVFLNETELEILYGHGIPRRYVDAISDEILRHRTTVAIAGDENNVKDQVTAFEEYLKTTQFHFALSETIKLQRLYGGAGMVLLIDDGLEPSEEVDINRVRRITGYVPLSRHELLPEDVTITDYSKPSHYRITTSQRITEQQSSSYVNLKVHHSRIARFDGLYLPWNVRVRNTGWGQSVLQLIWESYKRYESAMQGLESMTQDADLFVHKIPGLFQRIASGNEADLKKRLEANNLSRSIYGGMVVDTEEQLDFLNRALGNIASATEPFIKDLQAATGWPASILMGDSPGGLGKEGRYEERVWASLVEQWQEVYCRTPITEIFNYIFASQEGPTRGKVPDSWNVQFPSCFTQTDQEKAALRVQLAQTDSQYINLGVLNPIEVRESRFGGTEYSIETNLMEAITQQMIATTDAQFQSQMQGYQAQLQAAAPQEEQAIGEGQQEEPPAPEEEAKTDEYEVFDAAGLKIRVSHKTESAKAGFVVAPDGQRIDSGRTPTMVFGPHRASSKKVYKAQFKVDEQLIEGPYVLGFRTMKQANTAVSELFPSQNVVGLTVVPEGDLESFRAGWEAY